MSSIIERLRQFVEYKQISKSKFYKLVQLSNGYLDKNRNVGSDKIKRILETFPEINPDWLILGTGPMIKNEIKESDIAYGVPENVKLKYEIEHLKKMTELLKKEVELAKKDTELNKELLASTMERFINLRKEYEDVKKRLSECEKTKQNV